MTKTHLKCYLDLCGNAVIVEDSFIFNKMKNKNVHT